MDELGTDGAAKKEVRDGFRDLECFNMTLLTKQGWRIIQNPNSMLARIFKEKYFRHVDSMDSDIGSNPSYAWRSIEMQRSY
jgi:hypothetical protein